MSNQALRVTNLIAGIWLFLSAFLWFHSQAQFNNAWIVGLLATGSAATAMLVPAVRFANTALAVWLFISVWALPTQTSATAWNNVLVAIVMLFVSLYGPRAGRHVHTERPSHA